MRSIFFSVMHVPFSATSTRSAGQARSKAAATCNTLPGTCTAAGTACSRLWNDTSAEKPAFADGSGAADTCANGHQHWYHGDQWSKWHQREGNLWNLCTLLGLQHV